ncbi:MAG: serine/threonine protein phosphatase [Altererythrobacter sp. 66-12]|nr:MAG: serine/threonine protein phosphatase [Altererythrobacter sp. 66-12]
MPAEPRRWRWAAASRIGTSHLGSGTRKQDAYTVSRLPGDALCLVVSDGAGSASHGGQGASLVCRSLTANLRAWFRAHNGLPDDEQVMAWIDELRDRLAIVAGQRALTRRQFAATLVLLAVKGEELLALQIGDSAMVGRREGRWEAICWPENGEFASTTFFVTDDPQVRLRTARLPLDYDAFALFSDGIENVALDHLGGQPHARFFDPMMKPVDDAKEGGKLTALSAALGRYLDGAALCERTDDDKTLILLSGA